jgi:LytR cell envelope-related transcriptional attenuator
VRHGATPTGQNDGMSRQQRGGTGEVARGAGYAALLGALLIAVAVIIGIVLLQIGDRNDNGPASATKPSSSTSSTTTTTTKATTNTSKPGSTVKAPPLIAPGLLKLIVLNGGALAGQAGVMSGELKRDGYATQDVANDWKGHTQRGNSVYCRGGLQREGTALATIVGNNVPLHAKFPKPIPPFFSGRDCVVVVGSAT